ncbi:hypothetical protein NDS46_30915 (plasmid) [Paenibacillus thiaminolyticus]|uniref:hypothetical protein n=1 Tax=Paenibacillus thiaminolyticus TaxID=49283 RepID=UPI00232D93EC|nr:hypothetical protein [Paenibacillus thiaminolyticus]WCF11758.1 hypothetical protein NDS46_30915 [Paenibacillus thiaminolyticus]
MKRTWKYLMMFVSMIVAYIFTTSSAFAYNKDLEKLRGAFNNFFDEYRHIIGVLTALATLTSIVIFIFHMIQLGKTASNPTERRKTISNIYISLICTALLGGLTTINFLYIEIIFG